MDNHLSAKEIKKLRKSLDLSQPQFAAKLRVSAITISRWERGTQKPSDLAHRQLARLAK